jgi:hypothetical protein
MPRQARLDAPGTLHHVMIRGIEGQSIFREDKDRENFLSRLSQISEDTKARILAWTLMDNIPFAEIARHVGVCTSAVAKAVQSLESGK